MSSLASRRHRITLMAEVKNQGAGGRMTYTSPVIADVWASVEENNSSFVQRASHENLPARARFVTQFRNAYQSARRLSWRGMTYRITGS
ncbi:MAG: head-tail adaptor protein, partial [Kordiimonadaceae bacterium]|nr:head-tail adaptor protein [Kordiimonadaceae bacterium]